MAKHKVNTNGNSIVNTSNKHTINPEQKNTFVEKNGNTILAGPNSQNNSALTMSTKKTVNTSAQDASPFNLHNHSDRHQGHQLSSDLVEKGVKQLAGGESDTQQGFREERNRITVQSVFSLLNDIGRGDSLYSSTNRYAEDAKVFHRYQNESNNLNINTSKRSVKRHTQANNNTQGLTGRQKRDIKRAEKRDRKAIYRYQKEQRRNGNRNMLDKRSRKNGNPFKKRHASKIQFLKQQSIELMGDEAQEVNNTYNKLKRLKNASATIRDNVAGTTYEAYRKTINLFKRHRNNVSYKELKRIVNRRIQEAKRQFVGFITRPIRIGARWGARTISRPIIAIGRNFLQTRVGQFVGRGFNTIGTGIRFVGNGGKFLGYGTKLATKTATSPIRFLTDLINEVQAFIMSTLIKIIIMWYIINLLFTSIMGSITSNPVLNFLSSFGKDDEETFQTSFQTGLDDLSVLGENYLKMMIDGTSVNNTTLADIKGTTQINGIEQSDSNYVNTIGGIGNYDTSQTALSVVGTLQHPERKITVLTKVKKDSSVDNKADGYKKADSYTDGGSIHIKSSYNGKIYKIENFDENTMSATYAGENGSPDVIVTLNGTPDQDGFYSLNDLTVTLGEINSAYDTDVEVATFSTYKKTVTVKCEGASQTVTAYSGVDGKDESGALVQAKTGESLTDNGAASTDVVSSAIYEFIDKDGNTFFDGTESYYYANIGDKNPFGEEKTEADTTKTNYSYTTFVKAITAMCSYVMGDVTEDTDIEDYIDQYFTYAEKIYKNAITSGRYNLNITDKETGTNIAWIDEASGQTVTSNQSSLITYASMKYYLNGEPVGLMTDDETSNEWMHEHLTESELFAETNTESIDYVTWEQWQDYDDADNLIAVNDADNEFTESVVEYWLDEEMWELFTIRNPNYAAVFSGIDSSYLVGDTAIDFTPGQYDEEIIAIMRSWTFSDGRQLDDTAIAAMCGNFWAESGMNPARYVSNGSVITCLGLPSYYNGRANNLLSYAASKNVPYYDLTTQMEYIKSEIDARPELVNALTSTNSVEYKTGAFFDLFEGGSALSPEKYAAIKAENGTYHTPDGFDISWDRYYFNEYSGKYSIDFGKRLEAARTYASTIETTN